MENLNQKKELNNISKDKYHSRCGDCGKFIKIHLWILKSDKYKNNALCDECFCNYDDLYFW